MTARPPVWKPLALAVTALPLAVSILYGVERSGPSAPPTERLLYLRSGRVAERLMLSFDDVAADVYWIRTIQHYGRDSKSFRPDPFKLLFPLLDLTTSLDPHFNIAYRFGAIFLSVQAPDGPGRPDLAEQLLLKGLEKNPTRWQYAHDIGFIHYWYTQDYAKAGEWFARAASMPKAPAWVGPLGAMTRAQGGDREGARLILSELATTASEEYVRNAAERGLAQIKALNAIDQLTDLVQKFTAATGRAPSSLTDLFRGETPRDETGAPFVFDPATGVVDISPLSTLRPLPRVQRRQ